MEAYSGPILSKQGQQHLSGTPLFIGGAMPDIANRKEMEAELYELRYRLERKVEQRTEQLVRRAALLESCNAALCDKLALAYKELAALKQRPAHTLPKEDTEPNDHAAKLYIVNNQTQIGSNVQDKWGEHATAA